MVSLTVLFDACVLYPAPLRDLLMRLSGLKLFKARWTEKIHEEWMRNVLVNRPDITRIQLERTRQLMDRHVPDCLVSAYEPIIPLLQLPDPADRHVLAAAIKAGAGLIVTFNLKDFPPRVLYPFGITALHPDDFIVSLLHKDITSVLAAAQRQRLALTNPAYSVNQYLETLHLQGLFQSVEYLSQYKGLL